MSKRLPYYQSEPAEYIAGDIMYCSYAAQGVFTILRALYWQKDCKLTLTQANRRLKDANEFVNELINEDIIKVVGDNISINFLDEQFAKASGKSIANSENGKKGAAKRWANKGTDSHPISESIATPLKIDSESIALREDKEDKEDNICIEAYTQEYFLKRWGAARLKFDNMPTNIKRLTTFEIIDFNDLLRDYNAKEFDQAIQGLFQQTTFPKTRLRPTHFLKREHFETYLTCFTTKEKLFDNNKYKKVDRI